MVCNKEIRLTITMLLLFALKNKMASAGKFQYQDQSKWLALPGNQCGGNRQSPINIKISGNKPTCGGLTALKFNNYNVPVQGEFENLATNVEFVPAGKKKASVTNKFGNYILQQFHMHWGRNDREGSEHRVNGKQYAAEIHFVHLKKGASAKDTNIDTFSVVSVLCKAANIPITGIWKKLNPVPTKFGAYKHITNLVYNQLLPKNRAYYQYQGSLTTPMCNQTVQWFVLKNPILIPKAFLKQLRKVQRDRRGSLLTYNFRNVQPLNDRYITPFPGCKSEEAEIQWPF